MASAEIITKTFNLRKKTLITEIDFEFTIFHIKNIICGNVESEKEERSLIESEQVRTNLVSSPKDDNKQRELLLHSLYYKQYIGKIKTFLLCSRGKKSKKYTRKNNLQFPLQLG